MNNSKAYHIIKNTICFLIIFAIQAVMIYFLATGRIAEATNESLQSFVLINAAILGNVLVSIAISLFAHSGVGFFLPNITNLFIGIAVFVATVGFQEGFMKVFAVIFFGVIELFVVGGGIILSVIIYSHAKYDGELIYNPVERIRIKEKFLAERKKEEEEKRKRTKELEEKQNALIEKFSDSPVTREIIGIITRNGKVPYAIEINSAGLTFRYEDRTGSYIFRSHDLPDMNSNEERIFADVLNQKLGNIYDVEENKKYHYFTHSDGTSDSIETHIKTVMKRKVTRSF